MLGFGAPEIVLIILIIAAFIIFKSKISSKDEPSPEETAITDTPIVGKIKPSLMVLIFACCLMGAFFMPWFQLLGVGVSGYQIGRLGSYGNYAWIIPIMAGGTIALSIAKINNRQLGAFTGIVPLLALYFATMQVSKEFGKTDAEAIFKVAKELFSIGAYVTIISSVGLFIVGMLSKNERYCTAKQVTIFSDSSSEMVCPICAETIKAKALKCRYCGHLLETSSPS